MKLNARERREAHQMIVDQSKQARWLLSLGRYDSVWVVELESSGIECIVRYRGTKKKKHIQNVVCAELAKMEWTAKSRDPKAKAIMFKYKLIGPIHPPPKGDS